MSTHLSAAKIALNVPIRYYFVGGASRTINGNSVDFVDCTIAYHISRLFANHSSPKPLIVFNLMQGGADNILKCDEGYLHRITFTSNVYVSVSIAEPITDAQNSIIDPKDRADDIWSLLFLVVNTQADRFSDSGIYHASMDSVPKGLTAPDQQSIILSGGFSFEYHVHLTQDAV